jgi:SAM-dependent methyltransferase
VAVNSYALTPSGWSREVNQPTVTRRALPVRALTALGQRGPRYVWHKTLRRTLSRWPSLKRRFLYGDPRTYWTLRGGEEYFREQEGQAGRAARASWMAARIASYNPSSMLEVGCGYGKQLRALREHLDCHLHGVDFSPTQLGRAKAYLASTSELTLTLASGLRLPFPDRSFDLVLTSAVILHNPPPLAEAIRREVIRVSRRLTAHNEDTDVTYNRYGYDTASWYAERGFKFLESGPIPIGEDADDSQFCVAEARPS